MLSGKCQNQDPTSKPGGGGSSCDVTPDSLFKPGCPCNRGSGEKGDCEKFCPESNFDCNGNNCKCAKP